MLWWSTPLLPFVEVQSLLCCWAHNFLGTLTFTSFDCMLQIHSHSFQKEIENHILNPLHSSFYPLNWWRIAPHGLSRQLPPFFGRLKRRGLYILNSSCDLEWTLLIWSWTLSPRSSCECDCHGKRVFATVFARLTRSHHPLPMCSLGYF